MAIEAEAVFPHVSHLEASPGLSAAVAPWNAVLKDSKFENVELETKKEPNTTNQVRDKLTSIHGQIQAGVDGAVQVPRTVLVPLVEGHPFSPKRGVTPGILGKVGQGLKNQVATQAALAVFMAPCALQASDTEETPRFRAPISRFRAPSLEISGPILEISGPVSRFRA